MSSNVYQSIVCQDTRMVKDNTTMGNVEIWKFKEIQGEIYDNHFFSLFSFILYSFYASLLRYLFCIHTTRVTQFGKEKLIHILYWMFYIHTFLWTIFTHATSFNMDHLPLINSCFGIHQDVFLMESSTMSMLKRHFCILTTDGGILNIH